MVRAVVSDAELKEILKLVVRLHEEIHVSWALKVRGDDSLVRLIDRGKGE